MTDYISVKLPEWFREQFEELNEKHNLGYTTFPELIKELLRAKYREVEGSTEEED